MKTITFDITEERNFLELAKKFGLVMRFLEPITRQNIRYKGQDLYNPFLIAVDGPRGSGKSDFIVQSVEAYAALVKDSGFDQLTPLRKDWPSSDGKRNVKVWMRWQFRDNNGDRIEICSDDRMATDALNGLDLSKCLPENEVPYFRFREWPDEDFLEFSRVKVELKYDNRCRMLKMSFDPTLDTDRIIEILSGHTQISKTLCLNLSTSTANALNPDSSPSP